MLLHPSCKCGDTESIRLKKNEIAHGAFSFIFLFGCILENCPCRNDFMDISYRSKITGVDVGMKELTQIGDVVEGRAHSYDLGFLYRRREKHTLGVRIT